MSKGDIALQKLSEKQRLENENAALKALLSEKLLEIEQYKQQIKGNRSMIKFSVRYEQWLEEIKGQIQENTRENYGNTAQKSRRDTARSDIIRPWINR